MSQAWVHFVTAACRGCLKDGEKDGLHDGISGRIGMDGIRRIFLADGLSVFAGQDDHRFRVQVYHVRLETQEHLRGDFSPDSPANDVRMLFKEPGATAGPEIRNGVAHEDHAGAHNGLGLKFLIGLGIAVRVHQLLPEGLCCHKQRQQGKNEVFHVGVIKYVISDTNLGNFIRNSTFPVTFPGPICLAVPPGPT